MNTILRQSPVGRSSDIEKIRCRQLPDQTLIILPIEFGNRIRLLVVTAKLCINFIPGNALADRNAQFLFDSGTDLIGDLTAIPLQGNTVGNIQPCFITAIRFNLIRILAVDFPKH